MTTATGLGIAMAILATIAYQLGLVVEKRALGRLPAVDPRRVISMARILLSAPAWLAGFALMLCGLGLQVISLTLAPVTIVQPVQAAGVVVLLAASRVALRERLRAVELAGVLVIGAAVATIALSAGGAGSQVGHHADTAALAMVAGCSLLAGGLLGASLLRSGRPGPALPSGPVPYGISAGLFYGVAALAIKGLSATLVHARLGLALGAAIAASPYLYLLVGSSAAGMLLFQTGLQRCQVSVIGPVSNLTGSVYFLVAGTWLFGEHLPADPARLAMRLAGIAAAGVVVTILSRRPAATEPAAPALHDAAPDDRPQRRPRGAHRRSRSTLREARSAPGQPVMAPAAPPGTQHQPVRRPDLPALNPDGVT